MNEVRDENSAAIDEIQNKFPRRFGQFSFTRIIGRGAYGVVIGAEDTHGKEFAVKVVSRSFLKSTNMFPAFEQELRVHFGLVNQNVIKIFDIIYLDDYIYIVMELCQRGDLFSFISDEGPLNVTVIRQIFFQILKGVKYLHDRDIAHLDLKPDNILITKDIAVKLGDFGCCEAPPRRNNTCFKGAIGTLFYAAPEILTRQYPSNLPADIWSLGIILFAMAAGSLPWLPGTDEEICDQIIKGDLTLPHDLPSNIFKLIYKCCQVNRDLRPTIDELINDPWFDAERMKMLVQMNDTRMCLSRSMKAFQLTTKKKVIIRPNESTEIVKVNGWRSLPKLSLNKSPSKSLVKMRSFLE